MKRKDVLIFIGIGILYLLVIEAAVVVHELGHAAMATLTGSPVYGISIRLFSGEVLLHHHTSLSILGGFIATTLAGALLYYTSRRLGSLARIFTVLLPILTIMMMVASSIEGDSSTAISMGMLWVLVVTGVLNMLIMLAGFHGLRARGQHVHTT